MVTGFLGSGKTTLLKNLLNHVAGQARIGIVQNEFAPSGVDGTDLSLTGIPFSILEVHNGSVFCICLLGNFIPSLAAFVDEKKPDLVILESSGLSDPIAIAQLLQSPQLRDRLYLSHVWCVIDTFNFQRTVLAETQTIRQVRVADTVILNKTDLGSDNTHVIRAKIASWNPFAAIVTARFCEISLPSFLPSLKPAPVAITHYGHVGTDEGCRRPENISTVVLKTTRKISPGNFDLFMKIPAVRDSYRIKGYVRLDNEKTWALQASFDLVSKTEISGYNGNTEIIFMGPNLEAGEMNRKFRALATGG